jgi:hypothetical protein
MKLNVRNIIIYLFFVAVFLLSFKQIFAETVATSVIVGNSTPSFTVDPFEVVASTTANPTDVGTTITFQATGTDGNNENYYLAICKSDEITANNEAVPTCTGGNWCISSSTTSGSSTTCEYGTLNGDAESNNWFAFVCDHSSSSICSSSEIGTGDSGSPFQVNHAPSFPTIANVSPLDPGSTQTWSTAVGVSDADSGDTVRLLVCKTAGVSAGACDGGGSDTWCDGSAVTNNPSCSIGISIPTLDIGYSAFVYVYDVHDFGSTDGNQGIGSSYIVNNIAPVVSAISLNSGSAISTLNEGGTSPVVLGATITDNNGCADISTVVGSMYRSGIGYSACDTGGEADGNNCYPALSCSVGGGNTCDGSTDPSASYTCTAYVKYFADPTVANTTYSAETWMDTFKAEDEALNDAQNIGTGVEMNDLLAMDIGASLAFGNLSAGQTLSPLSALTVVTATGNVGLDQTLEGTNMLDVGDTSNTITVGNQRYALAAATAYGSGITLSISATETELNCKKTTSDVGETKPTYWGISIPVGTAAGTYGGTNTVIAVKGEFAAW